MKNQEVIDYLNRESNNTKDTDTFIKILGDFINSSSDLVFDEKSFNKKFMELLQSAKSIHKEFIPYSEITRIVYSYGTDGVDVFVSKFKEEISKRLHDQSPDDEIKEEYLILLKCSEHINLASKQMKTLYNQLNSKLDQADERLDTLDSRIGEIDKMAGNLKEKSEKLDENYSKLTVDFVTILGIFTSITFATFGGLQLLGNVFGRVKSLSTNESVGSAIMLGAIFLFGTYLILVALLTGISKLTDRNYTTTFPTRYLMILSFTLVFVLGLLYANPSWIKILYNNMFRSVLLGSLAMLIPLGMDYLYRKYQSKSK